MEPEKPYNPPAFPACNEANVNGTMGMTLRDYFAGQALAGIISAHASADDDLPDDEEAATWSYEYADAMLTARNA